MKNSKKSNVTQKFIEIIEKLQSIGVDTDKLVRTDTIGSLAEKSGIDEEKIKKTGLDPNYKIGQRKNSIAQACKGKGTYAKPNEKQVKELEQLGILRKDNSLTKKSKVIDKFIEVIEKLQNIRVDTNKLVSTDTIKSLAKKSEIDEEKIKEAGLDPNYKIGQRKNTIALANRGKGSWIPPTEEQVKKLKQLGISLEKRDVVEEFIEIIEKLQSIEVDTNKLVKRDTIESLAKKSGIDEEKIKEAGLDLNYKIGMKKRSIIQAYRRQGTGRCIPPTEEQVKKLKELGISLEKMDVIDKFIEIIEKLQSIGVDTNKLVQTDTIGSLAEKSGIDEEKIKKTGLDPNYKIGQRKNTIALANRGKGSWIPPTEEQVKKLKQLGISLEKRDVVEEFIEIIEKLQSIEVDTNKLVKRDTIESLAKKSGIDEEKIKEARLDPNYKIGQKRFLIAQACKGKGKYTKPNEKRVKKLEQLGILRKDNSLTKKSKVIDKFIEVIEKLQNIRVDTNKLVSTDTIESLAKKSGIDEEKIKEAGLDLNYKIGMKKRSIIQAYRRQGTGRCIPPTEEQVKKLKELGISLEKMDVIDKFIEIIEKLQSIGVDTNKLVQTDTIGSLAEKSGIDEEKIKEAGLDSNYKVGIQKMTIAQAYRGKGRCIPPTEEQVKKLKQLGISLEKRDVVEEFIEIIEKLQNIGVDTKNLVSADTIGSLAKKSEIDEETIKEAGLDPNYRIGRKRFLIAQACKGKGEYTKPNERQVNKLKELGIFLEKVTREELKSIVVEQKNAGEIEKNHKIGKEFEHCGKKIEKKGKEGTGRNE